MAKVFIAGHGRMLSQGAIAVPAGVSITWAVPARYNGSVGLSTALLSGAYGTWTGTTSAGAPFLEHYLCPDLALVMATKADAMVRGPWDPTSSYLLQPRLKFTTTLSSIILFLKRKITGPLEIYWTCCRSPIAQPSFRTRLFDGGVIRDVEGAGNIIQEPDEAYSAPKISAKGVDKLVSQRSLRSDYTHTPVVVNAIDGGVTFKAMGEADFTLQSLWPGVDEASKSKGRGRSGSFSGGL